MNLNHHNTQPMSLVSQSLTLRWSISCPIPHSVYSLGKVVNLSSDYKDEILAEPEVNQPNPSDLDFHRTNILPPLRPPIDELLIQFESETNERFHSSTQVCTYCVNLLRVVHSEMTS
ncbi:unnamed protein product [Vicia faba]|uniref:Uncharacterized protein n=1 Tax=Vicia faba TaxID=3906 RepID=A0AAV0ZJJ1_VICFA|nr:unnamed protein product [Vicia faba]